MSYHELVGSESSLGHQVEEQEDPYCANMPQKSIAYVPVRANDPVEQIDNTEVIMR